MISLLLTNKFLLMKTLECKLAKTLFLFVKLTQVPLILFELFFNDVQLSYQELRPLTFLSRHNDVRV